MKRAKKKRPAELAKTVDPVFRREVLVRRMCAVMGWEYKTCHVYTGIRKVAQAEAVPVGLDKLEEILRRLEAQ